MVYIISHAVYKLLKKKIIISKIYSLYNHERSKLEMNEKCEYAKMLHYHRLVYCFAILMYRQFFEMGILLFVILHRVRNLIPTTQFNCWHFFTQHTTTTRLNKLDSSSAEKNANNWTAADNRISHPSAFDRMAWKCSLHGIRAHDRCFRISWN